jgi:polyisoprenoid-binding protein YceI
MKRINWIIAIALSSSIAFLGCSGEKAKSDTNEKKVKVEDQTFNTNTENSVVMWKGTLVGVYDHSGTLSFNSGNLKIENGKIVSGSFEVDMTSMVATDENYDPEKGSTKEKLIGHLSSDDFFAVETFPTTTFIVKEHKGDKIMGELTIRGKTNSETVENVVIKKDGDKLKFKGDLTFDRQEYDVAWAHPMKDKVLMDEIELKIVLK